MNGTPNKEIQVNNNTNSLNNTNNTTVYYQSVLLNLRRAAETDRFPSKEELNEYMEGLKRNGMPPSILSPEKQKEILDLYDQCHKKEVTAAKVESNIQTLEGKKYITNPTDQINGNVLTAGTDTKEEIHSKDKEIQNFKLANGGSAEAVDIYNYREKNKNESLNFVPLKEAHHAPNASIENQSKINFFMSKIKNVHDFHIFEVDPEKGIFRKKDTGELFNVVSVNGEYQIKKSGETVYQTDETNEMTATPQEQGDNLPEKDTEEEMQYNNQNEPAKLYTTPAETMANAPTMAKPKVRKLLPPNNRAAFVKTTFLIITSVIVSLVIAAVILFVKK